ncbi:MAG: hypothetical protein AVDCRST_MAG12-3019, partial [uncultured Rubrobacteraceae bacterium]
DRGRAEAPGEPVADRPRRDHDQGLGGRQDRGHGGRGGRGGPHGRRRLQVRRWPARGHHGIGEHHPRRQRRGRLRRGRHRPEDGHRLRQEHPRHRRRGAAEDH